MQRGEARLGPDLYDTIYFIYGIIRFELNKGLTLVFRCMHHAFTNECMPWSVSLFQWFGNIVTMDWWDDLWLNEGFASFMEYLGANVTEPTWMMVRQNR